MVTTHFDLVSGPFHSPIFIGLHSVATSDNMNNLHTRAGELPRSASSPFHHHHRHRGHPAVSRLSINGHIQEISKIPNHQEQYKEADLIVLLAHLRA